MTTYATLLPDQFLTLAELRAMTEFPTVAARTGPQLQLYVTRAHILLETWLPFDDHGEIDRFEAQMQVATFMVAESLALANPTRAAQAAGITSETIGKYSYSRAQGGSSVGSGVKGDLVPDEALYILERWSTVDDDATKVSTTSVFPEAAMATSSDELRRFDAGDGDELAGYITPGWSSVPSPFG